MDLNRAIQFGLLVKAAEAVLPANTVLSLLAGGTIQPLDAECVP